MTVTNSELGAYINAQTEDTTPDTSADFVVTYDTSATATKKVKLSNLTAGGAGFTQGARVYHSTTQSITSGTPTALTFDSERYDTDTCHSTVTNTSRLTATTAGKYLIAGNIAWASSCSCELDLRVNGTNYIAAQSHASSTTAYISVSTVWNMGAGDYVELIAGQYSGGSVNVQSAASYSPEFMMQRIG